METASQKRRVATPQASGLFWFVDGAAVCNNFGRQIGYSPRHEGLGRHRPLRD